MTFIFLMTLGFVLLAYFGLVMVERLWGARSDMRRRIDGLGVQDQPPGLTARPDERFPVITRLMSGTGFAQAISLTLSRAGIKLKPSEFVGIVAGLAMAMALLAGVMSHSVWSEIAAAVIVFGAAAIYVKMMQHKRLVAFNKQLPDALSLMSSAVRSGYSFNRAMQMVASEMAAPISDEFRRVINETNVGLAMDASLTRIVERVRSYDLELAAVAIIIQQQVGGNLAEILDNISTTIRDRVKVQGELDALTAEGKLSGVILVLLPFVIAGAILVLNPGYLAPLIADTTGRMLIAGAIVLQITGALIIKRMLVLDY